MIKLVVSDLDGTMFGGDCIVPDQAPPLVEQLHRAGILFTIASGRAEWMIAPIAKKLGVKCPYIACNGATIMQDGHVIRRLQFPLHLVREASELADQLGLTVVYTIDGEERITTRTPWMWEDTRSGSRRSYIPNPFAEDEWQSILLEKVMYYDPHNSGSMAQIDAIFASTDAVAHVCYGSRSVEVTEKSVDKATALVALAKQMKLDIKDILMVADDQNDIRVLKLAGIGVAVANATPDAKSAADYICNGERFLGIKEAVERFCLGGVS